MIRLPRAAREFAVVAAVSIAAGALLTLLLGSLIQLMNLEYWTRSPELVRVAPRTDVVDSYPLVLRLRLLGFDENTGRVTSQLFAYTRDDEFRRRLEQDSVRIYVSITDGMSTNSITNLERARLVFTADSIPGISYSVAQSNVLDLKPIYLTDVSVFPFDTYHVRLLIWVASSAGNAPPFQVEVERSYFIRTLQVRGTPREVEIAAGRPLLDKIVIVGSSVIFLLICLLVLVTLIIDRSHLSAFEEAIALAGFLLATIGFREFAGFTSLQTRSFLDIVVFLVPLAALFLVFVLRFFRGLKRGASGTVPRSGTGSQ